MLRRRTRTHASVALGVVGAVALALAAAPAMAAGPKITAKPGGRSPIHAIQDDRLPFVADPAARVRQLADAGAGTLRVDLRWDLVAESRPVNGADPADPAYSWARYDAIVAAAAANKVALLFTVYGTPAWAADATAVAQDDAPASAIRPGDPADFGRFATAAATRYAPQGVHRWEAWNEPNIKLFLTPQYANVGGTWQPVSPATYAGLARAFYGAVKAVDPSATIGGAVTAPAGDRSCSLSLCPTQPNRVQPDAFIRALDAPGLRPPMDVVSHHPYPLTAPRATSPPSLSYVDLYNLPRLVKAIDRTYLAGKPLWLTEYGFATEPVLNYRTYFSRAQQAQYIVDAYRRLRADRRVTLASYYFFQDHEDWRSGILDRLGRRKPAYAALGLPFAQLVPGAVRAGLGTALVGQVRVAAGATRVTIQRRAGARWVTAASVRTSADGSFRISLRPAAKVVLRARWTGPSRTGTTVTVTSPPVTVKVR